MTDTKATTDQPDRWDGLKRIAAAVGAVVMTASAVFTFVATKPTDTTFKVVAIISPVALAALGIWIWLAKRQITGFTSDPLAYPRFAWRKLYAWGLWVAAAAVAATGAVIWYGYRDEVFTLAKIEKCRGHAMALVRGQPLDKPEPFREAVIFRLPARNDAMVYPTVGVTVARQWEGMIRLDSVKLLVEPLPPEEASPIMTQVFPPNEVRPNLYFARLSRTKPEAEAELQGAGFAVIDDKTPVARLYIGIEGEPGLYRVRVQITVKDERGGRTQVMTSDDGTYVTPQRTEKKW